MRRVRVARFVQETATRLVPCGSLYNAFNPVLLSRCAIVIPAKP